MAQMCCTVHPSRQHLSLALLAKRWAALLPAGAQGCPCTRMLTLIAFLKGDAQTAAGSGKWQNLHA